MKNAIGYDEMKKKVLFFLQSGVGGAERVTVTIGKNLDKEKFEAVFCLVGKTDQNLDIEHFIPHGYSVLRLPQIRGFKLLYALMNAVKKEKPDVVFSSIMYVNTKLLACSIFFPKIKFIVRNNNYLYTLTKSQKLFLKLFYRFADVIIAQTDEMANELIEQLNLPRCKVFALQNPVDKQTIDSKKDVLCPFDKVGKRIYVASGRFFPVKGFDILMKAFKMVYDKMPNSELYVVGKNTENCEDHFKKVVALAESLKIRNAVHFEGFQTNPYKYVKNADCFVLSSRNEGLPNVLIEALYLGTPVAATTCIPVISRIVDEGKNGFLAESENPESLAKAMMNAVELGRVTSNFQSAAMMEFQKIFEA